MNAHPKSVARFAVLALAIMTPGCSDVCGVQGAPLDLIGSSAGVTLTYGNFTARPNTDCPMSAVANANGLLIVGTQTDGVGQLSFCVVRNLDALNGHLLSFESEIFVELQGTANNCMLTRDEMFGTGGTMEGQGVCSGGADPAGFAVTIKGSVPATRTCGAIVDKPTITFGGEVAVAGP